MSLKRGAKVWYKGMVLRYSIKKYIFFDTI